MSLLGALKKLLFAVLKMPWCQAGGELVGEMAFFGMKDCSESSVLSGAPGSSLQQSGCAQLPTGRAVMC